MKIPSTTITTLAALLLSIVPLHAKKDPTKPKGMGDFVQQMHEQGLRGQALAAAIHAEQQRRGIGHGNGKAGHPPGQAKFKKAKAKRK